MEFKATYRITFESGHVERFKCFPSDLVREVRLLKWEYGRVIRIAQI